MTNRRFYFLCITLVAVAASVFAQSTHAIRGTVTDDYGGVIPGVTVTVTSPNKTASVFTNSQGRYEITGLADGAYRVSPALQGFRSTNRDITLAGRDETVDLVLRVGGDPAPADDPRRLQLEAAEKKWRERDLKNYEFRIVLQCFCVLPTTWPWLRVVDGVPVALAEASANTRRFFASHDTAEKIFAMVRRTLDHGGYIVNVTYDAETGFPLSGSLDPVRLMEDDDLTFRAELRPQILASPMLDAHNCYPENGQWADRLSRALATARRPIGIEQDLVWKPDGRGGGASVVAHDKDLAGGEPTLEDHFFRTIAPMMDAALAAGQRNTWPLIVLHFDFKTNEPEHHAFVMSVLKKYERWLTTSTRGADDRVQPLTAGPMLVLTEAGENQQRDFYDSLPAGAKMLIFGTVPNVRLTESRDQDEQAARAVSATPETLLPSGATNYRRWANFSWAVVERGGQTRAGDWTADDTSRLNAVVSRAHELGLWIRFYTLDGFTPAENRGWTDSYSFGSLDAARARWRAAVAAGVDFIASDQYERLAEIIR